jgi:uncharacterized protein YjbI with pentapeptide repeats
MKNKENFITFLTGVISTLSVFVLIISGTTKSNQIVMLTIAIILAAIAAYLKLNVSIGNNKNFYSKLKRNQRRLGTQLNKINDTLAVDPFELVRYYIEPDCQEINPADNREDDFLVAREPIFKKIDQFLRATNIDLPGKNQMFILSDVGMGKTSLLAMLKIQHLLSFWPKNIGFVLEKLGTETLGNIREIENKRNTFLLLDALDEDPLAYGRVKERLLEILNETKIFFRVIITCRTQFFPSFEKGPMERPGIVSVGGYVCPSKYLALFNDKQVELFLHNRFPLSFLFSKKKVKIKKAKEFIKKMDSLRSRPLLLTYIDPLMESHSFQDKLSKYNVYRSLIDSWLLREETKTKILSKELLKACEILAIEMQKRNLRVISERELDQEIATFSELESVKNIDIKGRSLLNRNSEGNYRFSHYSIQEFLVARFFIENPDLSFEKKLHATDFILQMLISRKAIKSLKNFDLRGAYLREVDLQRAELQGINLQRADLQGANLQGADFQRANLQGADLQRAKLKGINLKGVLLQGANLRDSDLQDSNLQGADFQDAILDGVNLQNASIADAKALTVELLLEVKSIYHVKGLAHEFVKEIRKKKSELFKESSD